MKSKSKNKVKNLILLGITGWLFLVGFFVIWVSLLKLPDFKFFDERKIQSSTKIYDRTGEILLYDIHQNIKRTEVHYEEIGVNIKNATVAIEDSEFYKHKGIRIKAIMRALWSNFKGEKIQGGSTITQQVIKGTLLTSEKTITRKVKEWILAVKLEKKITKEEILTLYLNEAPYGGNIYGIKEASKLFFNKEPLDLTMAESAYLAAIPNGPTYYSPYGKNRDKLEDRKNLVLKRMRDINFITEDKYQDALMEKVEFMPKQPDQISAPHFVFFVKDYLEKKYGEGILEEGGLKVITTINYNLQKKVEEITLAQAKINEKKVGGKNAAVIIIDPKTGQILAMVGSRDYFDKTIDSNFNVATASRQPGSSFKPIVYATAFEQGYTDKTVLFDLFTEFSTSCDVDGNPIRNNKKEDCYHPRNYNNKFRGPITLRNALAQSINIVAVKLLYLVGIDNVIKKAESLGITTLTDPRRYGLSLVIGGGETTLLEMTSAYSVFANEGVRHPYKSVLLIEDKDNNVLEEYQNESYRVLNPNITRMLSSIMSDNIARTPTFGAHSILNIPGVSVAVKTGTTNDNKDAWTIGYTPSVVVGVWAGNNDNTPMKKGGSAVAGPIWNSVMQEALNIFPRDEKFNDPALIDPNIPSILRGFWQGGETFVIDKISGALATEYTPMETREEKSITNIHSILYWIDKKNPLNGTPANPTLDPLYYHFEKNVQNWWLKNSYKYPKITNADIPINYDPIHNKTTKPEISLRGIKNFSYTKNESLNFIVSIVSKNQIKKIDIFINDKYINSLKTNPYNFSIPIESLQGNIGSNTIKVIAYDYLGNVGEQNSYFILK